MKGTRRSISMRDGEYIALRMYKDALNARQNKRVYCMTSVLKGIMFGELPSVPKQLLNIGMEEARLLHKEREMASEKEEEKEDPPEPIIGGGIFSF